MTDVSVGDSGNYSCQPRDLHPASVAVTILSERPAPDALQDKTTHTAAGVTRHQGRLVLLATAILVSLVVNT